jgi:hypothetical protein
MPEGAARGESAGPGETESVALRGVRNALAARASPALAAVFR